MFTGIVEALATVTSFNTDAKTNVSTMVLATPAEWRLSKGQSVAVNGACLTVTARAEETFTVELVPETKQKTTFSDRVPQEVNVERAMPADGRFEGHMVQGHIDATGEVIEVSEDSGGHRITVAYDAAFDTLMIEKGSITIDGVSLTATDVRTGRCSVYLIPHTRRHTTLGGLRKGDAVNIEFDMLGKYIAKLYGTRG